MSDPFAAPLSPQTLVHPSGVQVHVQPQTSPVAGPPQPILGIAPPQSPIVLGSDGNQIITKQTFFPPFFSFPSYAAAICGPPAKVSSEVIVTGHPTAPALWYAAPQTAIHTPLPASATTNNNSTNQMKNKRMGENILALPILELRCFVSIYVSTATVHQRITFRNTSDSPAPIDALFILPLVNNSQGGADDSGGSSAGNVNFCRVTTNTQRFYQTSLIDNDQLEDIKQKAVIGGNESSQGGGNGTANASQKKGAAASMSTLPSLGEEEDSSVFQLPILGIRPGEEVCVDVEYLVALNYEKGEYILNVPLSVPWGQLPSNIDPRQAVSIHSTVSVLSPSVSISSPTHLLTLSTLNEHMDRALGGSGQSLLDVRVNTQMPLLQPARPDLLALTDFQLHYSLRNEMIHAAACIQPRLPTAFDAHHGKGAGGAEYGHVLLTLTPPATWDTNLRLGRNCVFVLDRSGSMSGHPFSEAIKGLTFALQQLMETDTFNVVMFDHRCIQFRQHICTATEENKRAALDWARSNPPAGGTDILLGLNAAFDILEPAILTSAAATQRHATNLPFIYLFTDGCVSEEREIIFAIKNRPSVSAPPTRELRQGVDPATCFLNNIRIITFGIGSYCNNSFLRQLAYFTRGLFNSTKYVDTLERDVKALVQKTSLPILTNISLVLDNISDFVLYPFPIPDLYLGQPITISGSYSTFNASKGGPVVFPSHVTLQGTDIHGGLLQLVVPVNPHTHAMPLERIYIAEQLHTLTSIAWLYSSDLKSAEAKQAVQHVISLSMLYGLPTAYTTMIAYEVDAKTAHKFEEEQQQKQQQLLQPAPNQAAAASASSSSSKLTSAEIAACAVGGIVILGVGVAHFGNISATMSNLPILFSNRSLLRVLDPTLLCNCCQGFVQCLPQCAHGCLHPVGEICSSLCGNCQHAIGHACDTLSGCGQIVGGCANAVCNCVGSCIKNINVGDLCECFCKCLGAILEGICK